MDHPCLFPAGKWDFPVHPAITDVIAFDEIHAPVCIHGNNAVIVCLPRFCCPNPIHIRIPAADGGRICHHVGSHIRSEHRAVPVRRRPWNTAHNVYAKLKPQTVHIVRQRFESLSVLCGWKTVWRRDQPSIRIHLIIPERNILELRLCPGIIGIPLDVHNNVLPAVLFQMLCHKLRIRAHLILRYRSVVIIIAVPPHRRCHRKFVLIHLPLSFMLQRSLLQSVPRSVPCLPYSDARSACQFPPD